MAAVLEASGIVAGYGDLVVVHEATVTVLEGEVACLLGPNGAGKSTLLKAIAGLVRVRAGTVTLAGQDVTGLPADRVCRYGLGYVPQVGNVFPSLTVEENLDVGGFLRVEGVAEAKQRAYDLFPQLRERAAQRVGKMSGGERQMVAIARALMAAPRVLLLDEPSANLAPTVQDQVFERVRAIALGGTPVLMVEQNARKALAASDRGYILDQGRIKLQGHGRELLADENLGKHYLGRERREGEEGPEMR